jgi:hypothetical protein
MVARLQPMLDRINALTAQARRCVRAYGHDDHDNILGALLSSASSQAPIGARFRLIRNTAARAPWIWTLRRKTLPRLLIPSSFVLPPVESWRGKSPSHAATSLPLRNAAPLSGILLDVPTLATQHCGGIHEERTTDKPYGVAWPTAARNLRCLLRQERRAHL